MRQARAGVTLLEVVVVLAIVGLILAVAAPSFLVPERNRPTDLADVIAAARRSAVLRGEPVTLGIESNGEWRIASAARESGPVLATGSLGDPVGHVRVHLTPLGACVLEPVGGASNVSWDAVSCLPARAESEEAHK